MIRNVATCLTFLVLFVGLFTTATVLGIALVDVMGIGNKFLAIFILGCTGGSGSFFISLILTRLIFKKR